MMARYPARQLAFFFGAPMTTAGELVQALKGARSGTGWVARCPVHDDSTPSLSISEVDGRVLVHCHAGCAQEAVLDALRKRGLWDDAHAANGHRADVRNFMEQSTHQSARQSSQEKRPSWTPTLKHPTYGEPDHVYEYHDVEGVPRGVICRWDRDVGKKEIRPAVRDRKGWLWRAFREPRPLYNLPDLLANVRRPVLVVEGEKTAEAARHLFESHVVVTWPGGTSAVSHTDWSPLIGRDVLVWPDNDEPGRKAAQDIARRCRGFGNAHVRLVDPPPVLPEKWDLADPAPAGVDIYALAAGAPEFAGGAGLKTAAHLHGLEFEPLHWAVHSLIADGVTILAGRPKSGKSWMALDFVVSVAAGRAALGNLECEAGDTLYLALEDNERRLQSRLRAVLQGEAAPERCWLLTELPVEPGMPLVEWLAAWIKRQQAARLIIIDTLAKVRPPRGPRERNVYDEDYAMIGPLKQLADNAGIAIVLLHHLRKDASGSDPLDSVSGTAGITGAADTIVVLKREPREVVGSLYVRGRDVDEQDIAVEFDKETGRFTNLGEAAFVRMSDERKAIEQALRENVDPMTARQIAEHLGKRQTTVLNLLNKMRGDGILSRLSNGKWYAAS